MNIDRFFTAGLILGLAAGITAFNHGSRTAPPTAPLGLQSHHSTLHAPEPQAVQPSADLPAAPASGLGVGP